MLPLMTAAESAQYRLSLLQAQMFVPLYALLAPQLRYVHSNGVRHNRAQYWQYVQNHMQLLSAYYKELHCTPCGPCSLLTGRLQQTLVRIDDAARDSTSAPLQPITVESWTTEVWQEAQGQWQLLAFQSSKVAPQSINCL